jgi:hypothetical protein
MPQFHETVYGKRFFGGQLPQLIKQLENIGNDLSRINDLKGPCVSQDPFNDLKRLADDVARYDYRIAQILDEFLKD